MNEFFFTEDALNRVIFLSVSEFGNYSPDVEKYLFITDIAIFYQLYFLGFDGNHRIIILFYLKGRE
jgi:hypothetical protein